MPVKKPKSSAAAKIGRNAASGLFVMNTARGDVPASTVRFGTASVSAASPKVGELRRNVTTGQLALARAVPKIVKPGIALSTAGSVPLFRADPQNPTRLIREVNGKTSTGMFVDGKLKVLNPRR